MVDFLGIQISKTRVFQTAIVIFSGLAATPVSAQQSNVDYGLAAKYLILLLILGVFFITPTIVAFHRKHPNRWLILAINVVFGGTGIGWLGSLVWAFSAAHLSPTGSNGGESGLNLFVNDPQTVVLKPDKPTQAAASKTKSSPAVKSHPHHIEKP